MARSLTMDNRTGQRYPVALLVQAEWDDDAGTHYVAEGETENVGPEGALVHLQRELPDVGSRVQLKVMSEEGEKLRVVTEVLRVERNAAHPMAALMLLDATDEWRGLVWEPSAPLLVQRVVKDDEEDEDDEEVTH
jgi:hypothetical protein